ncbi:B12-binding domain-containing radical SAM protein [Maridesulfovibrio sp.]|uniref:B12-binding domain-containing radical SAM protein n=1 Tax=Maridesulfovibrio sp. TaxID=2795000 RepID=UPI003BA90C7D
MKVYLIKASAPGLFKEYKKYMGAPPQNIFSLAAATPRRVIVDMCDETQDMKPKMNTDADIVVICFHTPDAVHAYKMADKYRSKGKTVVLGGLHPSFMPDEAEQHADALLVGEVEGIWTQLLKDYKDGTLKTRYQRSTPVDMAKLRPYPTGIIPASRYKGIWSVLVSRGCVHRCEFCVIPPFFKGKYRLRPIENIVAEIKAAPAKWFELHSDNLTADRDYTIELFKALIPLNIKWVGESTIKMAQDEELLRLAAESGCELLLVGIETPSQAALSSSGKKFVSPAEVRAAIDKFHEYGIKISSSMIFGFDSHTKDIFQESLDFVNEIGIDEVESVILCPFAGTPLYKRLEAEGRLLTKDWSKYDCSQAVFKPKHMTQKELEEGATWFWKQIKKKSPLSGGGVTSATGGRSNHKKTGSKTGKTMRSGNLKWKSILALALIGTAVLMDMPWLWGILFLLWVIMDLKNRQTYLLEEIPRDSNPILYWIIVTMWFCFTMAALSWHPAVYGYIYRELPEESYLSSSIPKTYIPKVTTVYAAPKYKAVNFGMTLSIPEQWTVAKVKTEDGPEINAEAPRQRAEITALRINMGQKLSIPAITEIMEGEISKGIPFISSGAGTELAKIKPDYKNFEISFREYKGTLHNEKLDVIVGYGRQQENAYIIIGICGSDDPSMQKEVITVLKSFKP